MGLNITLVGLFCLVALFDNHISLGKTGIHIAMTEGRDTGDIGRFTVLQNKVLNNGRIRQHRLVHIGDVGQQLIGHLNEFQRLLCRLLIDCRHCCYGMPVIQRSPTSHAVFQYVRHASIRTRQIRQISTGNNSLDACELLRLGNIDFLNDGVRMR